MKWALLLLLAVATPIWALDPSEMLQDPVLEARARGPGQRNSLRQMSV